MRIAHRLGTGLALALVTGGLLLAAAGGAPARASDEVGRWQAHYERVAVELERADVAHLSAEQCAARSRMIEALRTYTERADFGRNPSRPDVREPLFVDDGGRRCAVAELLHVDGRDELVDAVAASQNGAYVSDLAGNPELGAWLDTVGLTVAEAARIQGPPVDMPEPEPPTGLTFTEQPDESEPEDAAEEPRTPAQTGNDTGSFGSRGVTRRAPGAGSGLAAGGAGSWWMWWELNKYEFIRPNRMLLSRVAITGDATGADRAAAAEASRAKRRGELLPVLKDHLSHDDARVRAAAAIAVGRVGGDDAVDALLPLLRDAQKRVREQTLLALGATGSPRAAELLRQVAREGQLSGRGQRSISPAARPAAIVALGIARRYGLEQDTGAQVADMLGDLKKRDRATVGTAAFLHDLLTPGPELDAAARKIAGARNEPVESRSRAIEHLSVEDDDAVLGELQRLLVGRKSELRRSAAVALGEFDHELVVPRLMTAYELEREPLTRAFLLISIGEQGGADAREFLTEVALKGDEDALRPWAALALGLLARDGHDPLAVEALRTAQMPRDAIGAKWLALGIAGDSESLPELIDGVRNGRSVRSRSYAALALALVGGDKARFTLLDRIGSEKSEIVRVVIAQGLGILGAEEDAAVLLDAMTITTDPALLAPMAVAIGFHGSSHALDGVQRSLDGDDLSDAARAAAVESVGLLLDRRPGLELPTLSRRTNYGAMPSWLVELLSASL